MYVYKNLTIFFPSSSESELSKMGAKISQLNQKMEKLKSLTKELTKEVNKGSDYSKQLARRYIRIHIFILYALTYT